MIEARPAGWDFLFLVGTVVGALGPELLLHPDDGGAPFRLAIENEGESLCFRENLRMLAHAPGLRLALIARVNLYEQRLVYPLAVSACADDSPIESAPRLGVPEPLAGRICLGFDEIPRSVLVNARPSPAILEAADSGPAEHPLGSLQRRWIATMLSGRASQRLVNARQLASEIATLARNGFTTGAALLNSLASSAPNSTDVHLAIAIYLHTCRRELAISSTAYRL